MERFTIETTEAQPVLSIRKITSVDRLPGELGKAYQEIIGAIMQAGGKPGDFAFAAFYNMDMQNLDVEMGFPVTEAVEGRGEIAAGEIPAGKKAVCMYKGPYSGMAPTYDAMQKWMAENGHEPTGVAYEFYYNSPAQVDESELLTKIVFPLK